ncbi:MoxR family ATPase [Candidatus Babeliales bacterium]|nr:MoxR family ATPase [Candidatus Babeliales bacterium]
MDLAFSQEQPQAIKNASITFQQLTHEISRVIVGQHDTILFTMIALLCDGHLLIEGVPGIAKTTLIKTVAQTLGVSFKRLQFTPDLLPADIIGTMIYNQKTNDFETKRGPIFANLILADEINRAPAKAQAALLEAMQERQVTIGSDTYLLESPFLVFATQNPLEQEGTYRLPEAQIDRFMFKLHMTYPSRDQEKEILARVFNPASITNILSHADIATAQKLVRSVYVNQHIVDYIVSLVEATRTPTKYQLDNLAEAIQDGASPRATIALYHAAQAHAFIQQRHFVTPDDVKAVAKPVMRHRITLSYHAEADNIITDDLITTIVKTVPTP